MEAGNTPQTYEPVELYEKGIAAAINDLIERGVRFQQKDGIVYDPSGKFVAVDASRQDAEIEDAP